MKDKSVFQNWKERKCELWDHQPDNAGVLLSAHHSDDTLITWYQLFHTHFTLGYEMACLCAFSYTSGLSMVWRIKDRSDGVPIKWLSSDDHLHLSCCAANSHWGAVGTSDGVFLTYSAYRIAVNFHGAKYSRLNTGPQMEIAYLYLQCQ